MTPPEHNIAGIDHIADAGKMVGLEVVAWGLVSATGDFSSFMSPETFKYLNLEPGPAVALVRLSKASAEIGRLKELVDYTENLLRLSDQSVGMCHATLGSERARLSQAEEALSEAFEFLGGVNGALEIRERILPFLKDQTP